MCRRRDQINTPTVLPEVNSSILPDEKPQILLHRLTLSTPRMRVHVCMHMHHYRCYIYSVSKKCVVHKSFIMHGNASCTCNHISTCDMLGCATVISSRESIIQMTPLMHHSSTPRTEMRNPNTLCLKCQFTPPGVLPVLSS